MSIALMTLAFKSALPPTPKFVLVALCDSANDQGECYPSVTTLMGKCSMGERTVQGALKAIEKAGGLRREFRQGRSTIYWLTPADVAPRRCCPPQNLRPTPADVAPPPPQQPHPAPAESAPPPPQMLRPTPAAAAPITIIEPSIEPSGKQKKRAPEALELIDVDPQVLADWKSLRVAKRAPVTATAIAGIRREASKAGLSLQDAMQMACERGWAGFKAEWIADRGGGGSKQAELEARNAAVLRDMFAGAK